MERKLLVDVGSSKLSPWLLYVLAESVNGQLGLEIDTYREMATHPRAINDTCMLYECVNDVECITWARNTGLFSPTEELRRLAVFLLAETNTRLFPFEVVRLREISTKDNSGRIREYAELALAKYNNSLAPLNSDQLELKWGL